MIELLLYSRSYCHLCDDMHAAVMVHRDQVAFDLQVIDVDADPALVAVYDELVPVLAARKADGAILKICHHFLDQGALLAYFDGEKAKAVGAPAS